MKFMPALRATAIAAVLGASSFANAATLVQNGSFEDTVVNSGSWGIFNSLPGWTTDTGNGIEVRNNAVGTAQDGNNFVELDTTANSNMMQTISTVLGQVYQLTFWYSPRINMPANTNGVEAWWGNTLLTTPAITGIGGTSNNWTSYTYSVTGTGSDVLKFKAVGNSDTFGGNIDNVSLSAVPLPGAALLFGSALLGFMGFSNRRKV